MLRPGASISNSAGVIVVGSYAIPCVTDWNGDGRKDLLVGYQPNGKIAVFLNCGSDAQPAFTNSFRLQAAGADVQLWCSGCGAPVPWVCDLDGDGKRDLLAGSGEDGTVWFYRNTNTDAAPILAAGVQLMTAGGAVSVGSRAAPYAVDWDGDGLRDLLCGAGDGYVYFFRNTGSGPPQAPLYAASVQVYAGSGPLYLDLRSVVRFFDWDGDGVNDLVCSSGTKVCWCRNTGGHEAPVLLAPVELRVPETDGTLVPIYTGDRMRLELADWNNDGVVDLLIGNVSGTVNLYDGYRFQFASIRTDAQNPCILQWCSAPYLKYRLMAGPSPGNLSTLVASNVASGGAGTSWTNRSQDADCYFRVQLSP